MAKAIRAHNLWATMGMVLLAALLVLVALVFAVRQTATTGGDRVARPAISADRAKGSSLDRDPYIDRHAAVVARYRHGRPR